jgi:transcriptional regulator GlxA family with amidase domain
MVRSVRRVVLLVPPGVHVLDLAGPLQVFADAEEFGARYECFTIGEDPVLRSHQGLPVSVSTQWPDPRADDLLLVPGWHSTGRTRVPFTGATLRWIADHPGTWASVCAGAFALAAAGILDGRHATTHHELQDELAHRHPRVHVVRDVLFTEDGPAATSAGIASGIDLALHLLARDHGPAVAARTARSLVVPLRRNGSAPQEAMALRHRDHLVDVVHRVQDVLDARFTEPLPLDELARTAGVSPRSLTRAFTAATGTTPLRYQQQLRVERATELATAGWTWDAAAHAVGLADARMLRRLRGPR